MHVCFLLLCVCRHRLLDFIITIIRVIRNDDDDRRRFRPPYFSYSGDLIEWDQTRVEEGGFDYSKDRLSWHLGKCVDITGLIADIGK